MSVQTRLLTAAPSITNGTSFVSQSVAPTANAAVSVWVVSQGVNTTDRQAPTSVAGAGLTFDKVAEVNLDTFTVLSLWRAMGAAPSTGAITLTFSLTQDTCCRSVQESTGVKTGANGANAFGIQNAGATTGTSIFATPGFTSAANSTLAASAWVSPSGGGVVSASSPAPKLLLETAFVNAVDSSFGSALEVQVGNGNQSNCGVIWSVSQPIAVMAVELISSSPIVASGPAQGAAIAGQTTQFSVTAAASAGGGALSYQWQTSNNNGQSWASVSGGSGATTAVYTTPAAVNADNGRLYRCVVTDANGSETSNPASFWISNIGVAGRGRRAPFDGWAGRISLHKGVAHTAKMSVLRRAFDGGTASNKNYADALSAWFFPAAAVLGTTQVASLSAALQIANSIAANLQTAVQAPQSAVVSINAAVAQTQTAQALVNAALQQAQIATSALQAAVQQGQQQSTSVNTAVSAAQQAAAQIQAALQVDNVASASINVQVQAGTTLTASLDAQVQAGISTSSNINAAVREGKTVTAGANLAVQIAGSTSGVVQAAVQAAATAGAALQLALQEARSVSASISAQVQANSTVAVSINAAVRVVVQAIASLDVALQVAKTASAQFGAVVAIANAAQSSLQVSVLGQNSLSAGLSLVIGQIETPGAQVGNCINVSTSTRSNAQSSVRINLQTSRRVNR